MVNRALRGRLRRGLLPILVSFFFFSQIGFAAGETPLPAKRKVPFAKTACALVVAAPVTFWGWGYATPWVNLVTDQSNAVAVTTLPAAVEPDVALPMLGDTPAAVYEVQDGEGKVPSFVIDLGAVGAQYKRRFLKFLDPSFPDDAPVDSKFVVQVQALVFRQQANNPEYADVLVRMAEIDQDIKLPDPVRFRDVREGLQQKFHLKSDEVPGEPSAEFTIEITYSPTEDAFWVDKISLEVVKTIRIGGYEKKIPLRKTFPRLSAIRSEQTALRPILVPPTSRFATGFARQ